MVKYRKCFSAHMHQEALSPLILTLFGYWISTTQKAPISGPSQWACRENRKEHNGLLQINEENAEQNQIGN